MKTYIFDIDGTLANTDHRNHHLNGEKKNWKAWYDAQLNDTPYWEIVDILRLAHMAGIKVIVCTGREESCREQTITWFNQHGIYFDALYMRKLKDYREDTVVKKEMLDSIRELGYDPVCVFEDRDKVVKMWRDNGLRCLQVQPGDY